jgi:ATP-binding cassette subfamily B protein
MDKPSKQQFQAKHKIASGVPNEIEGRALLDSLKATAAPPKRPFAFLRFLVGSHARLRVALMLACALLAAGFDALAPYMLARVINSVTAVASAHLSAQIWPWFAGLGGAWAGAALAQRAYELVDIRTSPRLRALAQNYLFAYLLGHSPRYFQENFAGKLGQKIKQAGNACLTLLNIFCFEVIYLLGLMAIGGTLFFTVAPVFAAVLLAWTVLYLAISAKLARRCVHLSKAFSEEVTTSTGRLIDAITNADIIRAFAKSVHERRLLSGYLAAEMCASERLRRFLVVMRLFQVLAGILFMLVLIGVAAKSAIAGQMSIGTFTMVFALGTTITAYVRNLSGRMLDFFEQLGTLTEALQLVGEPHEIKDRPGALPLVVREGRIVYDHVYFAHRDSPSVFEDLSLEIEPGEKIGLVGPSGAGKSTLVKLLRRQFEPQAGRILIDGQDITTVTWESLNEAIAEVPQLPGIFHRPVRDNIRYARPDAPESEVIAASIKAHSHNFIARRREAYDTIVGEQGIKLSGGERQRVAIARALIKDAKILVLDEATSSLDSESEHVIQEALWTVMQGRTVIAIAHRLSTIVGMDRIVYLEAGRIVEMGSHAALLTRGGAYARLWNRQVGGFITT